ncbi:MAG TPA: hypothetical protein VGR89_01215 [Puia sp.]|nr:hypothetical protein [Puia sp.]
MDSKPKKLNWKNGLLIYAVCWVVTFAAVYVLRQILIPRDELDCYARVITLQKAVDQWDAANPSKPVTEDIDENALVQAGFLKPLSYDHDKHYYFVGETAHGLKVKCNKHEDNPLILKLTGDTLLAVLVFIVFCANRKYVLFDPDEKA